MSCRIRNSLTGEEIKLNESKLLPIKQLRLVKGAYWIIQ